MTCTTAQRRCICGEAGHFASGRTPSQAFAAFTVPSRVISTEASVHRMPGQSQPRLCRLGSFDQNLICAISGIVPPNLVDEHELQILMKIDGGMSPQTEHPKLRVRNVCCRLLC